MTLLHQEGAVSGAFGAAGVDWDPALPASERSWRGLDPEWILRGTAIDISRLRAAVRRAAATNGSERFLVPLSRRALIRLDLVDHSTGGRLRARVVESRTADATGARLPEAAWRRLPDLDLLRIGAMPPRWLHPLVAGPSSPP